MNKYVRLNFKNISRMIHLSTLYILSLIMILNN